MKGLVLSIGTAIAVALALVACAAAPAGAAEEGAAQDVLLPIPDAAWDPDRPDPEVGWCAEVCIQSALAYYGCEVTQTEVNEAGEPEHPDLWADDVDDALDTLGVSYERWNEKDRNLKHFIAWIQGQLRQGRPVVCGVKLYPDENPKWALDHFVLAVGFNSTGLILNTQPDVYGRLLVTYEQLGSRKSQVAFANSQRRYFGRAIRGVEAGAPQ